MAIPAAHAIAGSQARARSGNGREASPVVRGAVSHRIGTMYIPRQMPGGLRITVVNAAYDPSLPDCDDLLERYETLTDWCDALSDAGADVHVVQRFAADAVRRRGSTDF